MKAAFIHVLGDFLQSLGVFIAALVIYFKPEWALIDPICTFVFAFLVLATTLRILRDTVNVLMEGQCLMEGVNNLVGVLSDFKDKTYFVIALVSCE